MVRNLLISGDRANFTTLAFDEGEKKLTILANYKGVFNASWVEPISSQGNVHNLVGLSEGTEGGLLYTFEVNFVQKTLKIKSQQPTRGAPAHCEFELIRTSL